MRRLWQGMYGLYQWVQRKLWRFADWWEALPRGHRLRIILIPLLCLVVLSGAYYGVREWALRSADQLRVTVTQVSGGPYRFIYQHTFGRALAAEAEDMINNQMTPGQFPYWPSRPQGYVLTGNHPEWQYRLDFLWHGLTLETATTTDVVLPEGLSVCALGICDLRGRQTITPQHYGYSFIQRLVAASGGVIPTSPQT